LKKDKRKGEVEREILNVLAEALAGKFKFVKLELEESDIPALHRAIGGPKYVAFANMFRALRGLKILLSYSSDQSYFRLIDEMLVNAHPMDLHEYHDRRAY
jgi:hypothetical protein